MSTGIVILAAGESARMGEPKQLLAFRGKTLLAHAIETAHSIPGAPVAIVLGAHAAQIRARVDEPRAFIVENPDWRDGMGGSLRAGLSTLLAAHPSLAAVIFMVCDQPLLTATTLGILIATHQHTGRDIVASEYGDRGCDALVAGSSRGAPAALGVPALFARAMFPALLALDGCEGARTLIQKHRAQAAVVPFPDGAVDLDTPADYAAFNDLDHVSSPSLPSLKGCHNPAQGNALGSGQTNDQALKGRDNQMHE